MEDLLEIGTIVAAQGLNGELRVLSESDFPERFEKPGQRWLLAPKSSQPQEINLLAGRYIPGKNVYVIRLAGINNREDAESLRGYKLLIAKSARPQLFEDEYHVSDLIHLEVYNQLTAECLGIVTNVLWAGHDLLEVTLSEQPETIISPPQDLTKITRKSKLRKFKPKKTQPATVLIPFVREIVPVVDLENRRLEIKPPKGLLEINQKEKPAQVNEIPPT